MIPARIHFIDMEIDTHVATQYGYYIPSIGDEIRIERKGDIYYYTIVCRIYIYDEPECLNERINIGIRKINDTI